MSSHPAYGVMPPVAAVVGAEGLESGVGVSRELMSADSKRVNQLRIHPLALSGTGRITGMIEVHHALLLFLIG